MIFKKLAQKLSKERKKYSNIATNPLDVDFDSKKSVFLDKLTKTAVNMYERNCDIKNFAKLALSNPENNSHNEIMDELFSKGILDVSDDEKLLELSDNTRFLRDLGLTD